MRYVVSDTHFGHGNVIEYCDRPFEREAHMNSELISRWNQIVGENDSVLHLGDVRHGSASRNAEDFLDELNGNIVVVRGNHDSGLSQNTNTPVVESCRVSHGRYHFYCHHRPEGSAPGWSIHGHTHGSDPLIDPDRQIVNVCVENTAYRPLAMDDVVQLCDTGERVETIETAP